MLVKTVAPVLGMTEEEVTKNKRVLGQVPANFKLKYPCVKYNLSKVSTMHANNLPYHFNEYYTVTVIDREPESPLYLAIRQLPHCSVDRIYEADNLYHYTFSILY